MNGVRLYFETKDVLGATIKCYGDYLKDRQPMENTSPIEYADVVVITDWGMLEEINGKLKWSQPAFIFPIVESKRNEIIFPDYEGIFNQYPTIGK